MSDARTQQSNSPSGTIADSDTFTYDDAGRMLTAVSGRYSNTVTYNYDDAGRKATEALTISGKTYTVSLDYDAKGQLIEYTYPDGTDVDRTYTDRGELYQVKYDGTTIDTRTYDNGGRMTGSSYNNGVSETRAYNSDNTLASISFSGASIGNMTYGWDDNKNKTSESITGTMSGYGFSVGGSGYDDEDRLVNFNRTDGNLDQSWSLSEVGDWDSVTTEGSTQTRTHGPSHELTAGGGGSVSHDVKGNMTLIPSQLRSDSTALALNWDMDNRLNTADVGNNSSVDVTYKFDALGRRVYRDDGTDTTIFFQSGQQTIADYASGAAATAPLYNYVYASYIDEPVYRDEPSGSDDVYFHRNQQYSIVALTSAAGSIVERYAYSAYGIPTIAAAGGMVLTSTLHENRYLYTGREWDEELNLYHYRARMYDPELGRFCSKDPILFVQHRLVERVLATQLNRFRYVSGRPLRMVDPSGLLEEGDDENDMIDDIRDALDKVEDAFDDIINGPPDITNAEPLMPIGPDDIIGVGTDAVDTALDLIFELGKPGSPCNNWLRNTYQGTLCSHATCKNKPNCDDIAPNAPNKYNAGPYGDCVDKLIKDKPGLAPITIQTEIWKAAQKLKKKCIDGPSTSKCCTANPRRNPPFIMIHPKACPGTCYKLRQKCRRGANGRPQIQKILPQE